MNIYGDTGNVRALEYRLKARNFEVKVITCDVGDSLPADIDIIVTGGGQDSGQLEVEKDLQQKASALKALSKDGVVVIAICGTYQLLGHRFITSEGKVVQGIGIFDLETRGSAERLIGNVIIASPFGELVGFENHSGKTFLAPGQESLGKVLKGAGNNGHSGEEGAITNNVFGTYMHGPILPKSPQLADELIRRALVRKFGTAELAVIDDADELAAAKIAKSRPR